MRKCQQHHPETCDDSVSLAATVINSPATLFLNCMCHAKTTIGFIWQTRIESTAWFCCFYHDFHQLKLVCGLICGCTRQFFRVIGANGWYWRLVMRGNLRLCYSKVLLYRDRTHSEKKNRRHTRLCVVYKELYLIYWEVESIASMPCVHDQNGMAMLVNE